MADTSLDDFFAKKDKSKRKNKAAGTLSAFVGGTTNALSTITSTSTASKAASSAASEQKPPIGGESPRSNNSEDNNSTKDERPSGKSAGTTATDRPNNAEPKATKGKLEVEDEWREVEEETKDYSGLKIQNLQISDLRDEEQERIRSEEFNDEGDQPRLKEGHGPWNKTGLITVAAQPPPPPPPVVVDEFEVEEPVEEQKKAYVAPAMRSGGAASFPSGSVASKARGRKYAPELDSEEHFPSLSAATDVRPVRKGDVSPVDVGFEAVKRGSRPVMDDPANRGPRLTLGNKFDALSRGGGSGGGSS